jgi:hypothetical protein
MVAKLRTTFIVVEVPQFQMQVVGKRPELRTGMYIYGLQIS